MPSRQGGSSRASNLTYAAAAWGTVAAATYLSRLYRRRRDRRREARVASEGGLLPDVRNAVAALEFRASEVTNPRGCRKLALEGADGDSSYTWREYRDEVRAFARALCSIGPSQGEGGGLGGGGGGRPSQRGVAVHAFNEPRWFFSAVGALAAGWTVSGIYLTNTYEQAAHVLRTSEVRVLVVESRTLFDSVYGTVLEDFPALTVVLLEGGDDDESSRTPSYESFVKRGSGAGAGRLPEPRDLPDDAVATLVYTSGTTGNPKAVELTHGNIHRVCAMMHARIPLAEGSVVVSYLPLSHIAAMGIDLFSPIYCGASVHFADSNALRGTLKDTLVRVRPTLFFGVPRVWEKMSAAMQAAAAVSYAKPVTGGILRTIGTSAKAVGRAWYSSSTPEIVRCAFLAPPFAFFRLLAYRKVRRGCGLDRCSLLYTGAAPLPFDTLTYLRSVDMPLLEVYGMSESTGAIAVCGPSDTNRPRGACGRPLPLGEVEIGPDGEVLWRGGNNMLGYKGLPAATEATLKSRTMQLHTGDLGRLDGSGYLYITGRKKDLLITAGGENVAPTPIEETILSLLGSERAGHVVLVGDERKFLTILIAPADAGDGVDVPHLESADVEAAMKEYNDHHAKSRAQRVQKAHVLERPLAVSTGELTPTMKVKRAHVVTKYAKDIEAMYKDGASTLVGYSSMNLGNIKVAA